jgi:LmbE family N-acetylglucosaminyl deacetylase
MALPEVSLEDLVPLGHRAVVVAPHPDDEVLGAGGLMALLAEQQRELLLIAVTDGTGSHPGSTRWPPDRLARERPLETQRAMVELGWHQPPVIRLGLQDGGLTAQESSLTVALSSHLRSQDVVFTTFLQDAHPDHEATARACVASAQTIGARVLQMPIWSWHWAKPGDPRLPWSSACQLKLSPSITCRKRKAVAAFVSQTTPDSTSREDCVLPPATLLRLLRPMEVFFR